MFTDRKRYATDIELGERYIDKQTTVRSQAELDQALADKVTDITIDSPRGVCGDRIRAVSEPPRARRGDQCDETCTTDCGHCKGRTGVTS